jgi:uncharacterized membrane protein (GlpM family)
MFIVIKYLISAGMIVFISEAAKRSDKLGGLIASLPLITILTLIWLYAEKQPIDKIANHAWYTFWYVIPTLPMFLMFPVWLKNFGFWLALLFSMFLTIVCFILFSVILNKFGIDLW